MPETSILLASFAVALLAAALSGAIAASLRQSVILGYIIAGILVGPYTPGYVADIATVEGLAAIGVILLLFVTGMQVSFRDLSRAGPVVMVGALVQVGLMVGIGYLVGQALGWGATPSFVLGAVVSNSSSTVISKLITERGDAGAMYSRIALAWSSIQDLTTIVLVVMITALAGGGERLYADMAVEVAKAAVFLTILVPVGGRALPWIFTKVRAIGQREVFLLSTAAMGLVTAYVASLFGLSPALGAFVAGVVLGESDIRHEVIDGLSPMRDIFVGLFFVSIGMLVDPMFVLENAGSVLLVVLLIVVVKGGLVSVIARLFRVPPRTSILAGVSLAQSAEFSFLIASIGVTLGALTGDQFSTLVGGAALTVMVSPWLVSAGSRLGERVEQFSHRDLQQGSAEADALRAHAVVCGHGRVGTVVADALMRQGIEVVVIDENPATVAALRDREIRALMGRADNEVLLARARLSEAATLVIALPDRSTVRRLVRLARAANPALTIVARTHEIGERDFLEANGVDEAVVGELELALEIVRYALRSNQLNHLEIEDYIADVRHEADADEYARRVLRGSNGGESGTSGV